MTTRLDPQEFNLPPRTVLEQTDDKTLALIINRKSRIIMADGRRIQANAEKIRKVRPDCRITLRTTAPVCSKTVKFLEEKEIAVQMVRED